MGTLVAATEEELALARDFGVPVVELRTGLDYVVRGGGQGQQYWTVETLRDQLARICRSSHIKKLELSQVLAYECCGSKGSLSVMDRRPGLPIPIHGLQSMLCADYALPFIGLLPLLEVDDVACLRTVGLIIQEHQRCANTLDVRDDRMNPPSKPFFDWYIKLIKARRSYLNSNQSGATCQVKMSYTYVRKSDVIWCYGTIELVWRDGARWALTYAREHKRKASGREGAEEMIRDKQDCYCSHECHARVVQESLAGSQYRGDKRETGCTL